MSLLSDPAPLEHGGGRGDDHRWVGRRVDGVVGEQRLAADVGDADRAAVDRDRVGEGSAERHGRVDHQPAGDRVGESGCRSNFEATAEERFTDRHAA